MPDHLPPDQARDDPDEPSRRLERRLVEGVRRRRPTAEPWPARVEELAPGRSPTDAAVLVPLLAGGGVLFTERRSDLAQHGGQISFPGGRADDDDRDLLATALREAHEEVGLEPDAVEPVGRLDPVATPSGFVIHPFVARCAPDLCLDDLRPEPGEVARILTVSLTALAAPGAHRASPVRRGGVRTLLHEFHVVARVVPPDEPERVRIWGATGRLTRQLTDLALGVG